MSHSKCPCETVTVSEDGPIREQYMGSFLLDFVLRNIKVVATVAALLLLLVYEFCISGPHRRRYPSLFGKPAKLTLQISPVVLLAASLSLLYTKACDTRARTFALEMPRLHCSHSGNSHLLIFVHGWAGDPQGTWRRFPDLVCDDRNLQDSDVLVLNYPTFMQRRNLDVSELASWLNEELDASILRDARYARIAVVAHSMGGLISREIVLDRRIAGQAATVGVLVEV